MHVKGAPLTRTPMAMCIGSESVVMLGPRGRRIPHRGPHAAELSAPRLSLRGADLGAHRRSHCRARFAERERPERGQPALDMGLEHGPLAGVCEVSCP